MEMWLLPDSIGDTLRTMQENTNSILRCIFGENPVVAHENVVVYEFRFLSRILIQNLDSDPRDLRPGRMYISRFPRSLYRTGEMLLVQRSEGPFKLYYEAYHRMASNFLAQLSLKLEQL